MEPIFTPAVGVLLAVLIGIALYRSRNQGKIPPKPKTGGGVTEEPTGPQAEK
jgi:hypothetical protein